jgi:hypothetical protein
LEDKIDFGTVAGCCFADIVFGQHNEPREKALELADHILVSVLEGIRVISCCPLGDVIADDVVVGGRIG